MIDKGKTCQGCPDRIMDGIGTRDEWYDERIIDDDSVVADCRRDGKKERRNAVK